MTTITKNRPFAEQLGAHFESALHGFGDAALRRLALESFLLQGIPGRKSEEYKYVNVGEILKDEFIFSSPLIATAESIKAVNPLPDAILVVIENGRYNEKLSSQESVEGLKIIDIAKAEKDPMYLSHYGRYADFNSDPFIAMNTAVASGGVFISIEKGKTIGRVLHIINISTADKPFLCVSRNLVIAEENSECSITESFISHGAKTFTNSLSEICVGKKARMKHYKIQDESTNGFLLNTTHVFQEHSSVFTTNNYTLSGSFVRNNLNIALAGEQIETHLNGLYLTSDAQVVDNHTLVDHRMPNCNSNELYKGIIEDRSAATFNGKIFVRRDAQKTNAFQSNRNILLSDEGTINTKPQLEIYADDVKCSHGTSTGKLDPDMIFYLRARGLSETSAKKLLMHAFASEVVNLISIPELRQYVENKISTRFE